MGNARTHVGVEVGDGLVARFGEVLVLVADPGRHAEGTEGLLDAVESTASAGESPGAAVAFRLARIFAGPDLAAVPPFGLVAPTEDGYVVLLHGSVWAEIARPDGLERLSGGQAVTWVDRIIKAPVERLTMGHGDQPVSVDPRSDLRAGLVPGSGFVLTSGRSTGVVEPLVGSWAGELQGGAAPAPVAGGLAGPNAQGDQPPRDHRASVPAQAEAAAAVAQAAWALVEEAAPHAADPEPAEPQAVEPQAVEPDLEEPGPVEPEAAATQLDAPTTAEPAPTTAEPAPTTAEPAPTTAEPAAGTLLSGLPEEAGTTEVDPEAIGADIAGPEAAQATSSDGSDTWAAPGAPGAPGALEPGALEPAPPEPVAAAGLWSAPSQAPEAMYPAPTSSEAPDAASAEPAQAEPASAAASFAQPVETAVAPAAAGSAWDQPTTAQPMTADPAAAGGQFRWGADAAPGGDSAQVGATNQASGAPSQTGAWLIGTLVGTDGARLPLDRSYVLGREPENDPAVLRGAATPIRLPDNENLISRVQAYITVDGGQVSLLDASSANGTYVAAPGAETWTRLGPDPVLLPPTWSLRVGNRVFTYVAGS